jgi:chromosomal replication initiation ATPase DnaA
MQQEVVQIEVPAGKKIMLQISIVAVDITPAADTIMIAENDVPSLSQLAKVIHVACAVPLEELRSSSRKEPLIFVRHLFVQLASLYNYNTVQVASFINRDHSTVINSLNVFKDLFHTLDDALMVQIAAVQPYVSIEIKPYHRTFNKLNHD